MKIEINNRAKSEIDLSLVRRIVNKFAKAHDVSHKEISIAFIGDAEIKKLNQTYRRKNEPTDVLTFAGEEEFWGEIIIDFEQIKRQAGRLGHSAQDEMIFILVHGLLHLLGYNDETEKGRRKMIKQADSLLKKLNLSYD